MHRRLDEYSSRYGHVAMSRSADGVLEVRLHTNDGPLVWGDGPHTELARCFRDIADDADNRVVILTGTGDRFITKVDTSWVGEMTPPKWDKIYRNGKDLLGNLLDIPVPVVAAINGPAAVHAELAVVSDITIAADHTYFQDAPHFRFGTVPGDGVHIVWPRLIGPNRARHFLLTGRKIGAQEALDLGIVNEVLAAPEALPRAQAVAAELAQQPTLTLRYAREVLVTDLRRAVHTDLGHGLALEGLGAYASWPT
ncbi:MAG: enoyl-CoA hydratase/isomerase family protein [Micromonosporaceae bacterium]|nr:enoyl-CoA hydratase/isomerase family protein [Micromonosporaceae bacterium]